MKLEKRIEKVSEKTQRRMDKIGITLGLSLLVAAFVSFFVLEAYAYEDLFSLNCPENAYHGLDNQGNAACRDILSNKIVEPEPSIADSDSGKTTESFPWITTDPETGEITLNDGQTDSSIISILGLIGIIAAAVVFRKKVFSTFSQIRGWNSLQKEQVRNSQYGRCNICYKKTTKWAYDHIDGNKRNNDISNCQGLCRECKSEKMMVKI